MEYGEGGKIEQDGKGLREGQGKRGRWKPNDGEWDEGEMEKERGIWCLKYSEKNMDGSSWSMGWREMERKKESGMRGRRKREDGKDNEFWRGGGE